MEGRYWVQSERWKAKARTTKGTKYHEGTSLDAFLGLRVRRGGKDLKPTHYPAARQPYLPLRGSARRLTMAASPWIWTLAAAVLMVMGAETTVA